jgi:cobalamin biosynthesis protein CobT
MTEAYFKQKITSVMTDNMYDRRVVSNRGSLDMRRLYKVPTGTSRVFTQKKERKGKNYNVVIAIDTSGSMGHGGSTPYLIDKAAECAVILERNFMDVGINTGIVTYNARVSVKKAIGAKYRGNWGTLQDEIEREAVDDSVRNGQGMPYLACNHDYDGIKKGYELLQGREGTNMLIVISDGNPNCDYGSSCGEDGRGYDQHKHRNATIHSLIHEHGDVITLGVGIYYQPSQIPNHIVVNNVGDLRGQFIGLLEKHIKRG